VFTEVGIRLQRPTVDGGPEFKAEFTTACPDLRHPDPR
jgi:hypothetical protein